MSTVDVTPEVLRAVAEHLRRRAESETFGAVERRVYLGAADVVDSESMREGAVRAIKRRTAAQAKSG